MDPAVQRNGKMTSCLMEIASSMRLSLILKLLCDKENSIRLFSELIWLTSYRERYTRFSLLRRMRVRYEYLTYLRITSEPLSKKLVPRIKGVAVTSSSTF